MLFRSISCVKVWAQLWLGCLYPPPNGICKFGRLQISQCVFIACCKIKFITQDVTKTNPRDLHVKVFQMRNAFFTRGDAIEKASSNRKILLIFADSLFWLFKSTRMTLSSVSISFEKAPTVLTLGIKGNTPVQKHDAMWVSSPIHHTNLREHV